MKIKNRIIAWGIKLSIIYYLVDVLIDYLIFYKDLSFIQILITNPPVEEIYTRLLGVLTIIIFSLWVSKIMIPTKDYSDEKEKIREKNIKLDFGKDVLANHFHQIKNQLNTIIGFSKLIRDPKLSPESKNTYVNHVLTSGHYILELVNNIGDIKNIETGQIVVNKQDFQLNQMLQEIYEQFNESLIDKDKTNVELILKQGVKDEFFTISTDKVKLRRILDNLLENSISLTNKGIIEFGYRQKEDQLLEFYVKDTGAGFSPERLEIIMKYSYLKVIDFNLQVFDIAALRINISNHFVKAIGGKLVAESKSGKVSEFVFTIPLNEVEVVTEEETKQPEGEKKYLWPNKHILITEDIESNYMYLCELLKPTNVKYGWATNGKEAVDYCLKNKDIDLILMDILMPVMDGYEAAKKIKEICPDIPIIAQTAYSMDEGRPDELKNFEKYLIKPIWAQDLYRALSEFLK